MKVLSYLELMNPVDKSGLYSQICRHIEKIWQGHLLHFYSQPFKFELITELFDGWEYDEWNEIFWYEPDNNDVVASISEDNQTILYNFTYEWRNIIPETLDDFIRDCQRINIPLFWRQK